MAPVAAATGPVCLIHGEDDYAVKGRARQLYHQWCEELGGMDHETLDAHVNNSDEALKILGRLRESLQTLPFFGSGKVIWLRDCNFLGEDRTSTSQSVNEVLAELSQELKTFEWRTVRLLVSAGKVDKRKSFYKTLEKLGHVEVFAAWSIESEAWPDQAEIAARQGLQARNKKITPEAVAELVSRVGPNSQQLANEIEKLSLYLGERTTVEPADVAVIVTRNKQARAFAVAEALGERDLPRLLRTLDEELWQMRLDRQKSAIGLLYGLIGKVRALIFSKELIAEGLVKANATYAQFKSQLERIPADKIPEDRRFSPLAVHPYVLFKALAQASAYSTDELVRAMKLLLDCNQQLVSRGLDDALLLQQTLVEIVRGEPAATPARSAPSVR